MILYCNVFCMFIAILIGKRYKQLGFKQYFIIAIITLFQVAFAAYSMYTMDKPPLLYYQH
jgi:hypothetical protein